jgi:hypothetical protein
MTAGSARPPRGIAAIIFASAWLFFIGTAGGTSATGDAVAMLEVATSIVDRGALDVPASQSRPAWRGVDGRYYTPFGIGQSLYDIPFLLAARAMTRAAGGGRDDEEVLAKALVAGANTIPMAIAVAFSFLLAWRLSGHATASALASVVVAIGTLVWPYAKFGANAALTTGALAAGVYGIGAGAIDRRPRVVAGGGAALALALLTRHEMAIAAFVGLAWLAWRTRGELDRGKWLFRAAVPVCIAIAVGSTLNAMRFGHPLDTGHRPDLAVDGFRAFLLSPAGSLVLYAPPVIAAIALLRMVRAGHALAILLLAVSVALLVFYGSLADWRGTRSYGPRYLVPVVPLLVCPIAVWIARARSSAARAALALLCGAGLAVQIPAVAVDFSRAGVVLGQPSPSVHRDEWQWSPLVVNIRALGPATSATVDTLVSAGRTPPDRGPGLASRLPFGLDLWWVRLAQLGLVSPLAAVIAGALQIAAAVWLAGVAIRRAGAVTPWSPSA